MQNRCILTFENFLLGVSVEVILVCWADSLHQAPGMEGQGQGGTGNISLLEALGFVARSRRVGSEGVVAAEEEYVDKEDYWHDANGQLRFLVVPPEAHESVYNPLRLGLLQYVSKNVGMRRARGRSSTAAATRFPRTSSRSPTM